jgi:hypothetical protein
VVLSTSKLRPAERHDPAEDCSHDRQMGCRKARSDCDGEYEVARTDRPV